MTFDGKINAVEALQILGLYNPANKAKPNTNYLNYLYKRGLLKRFKLGHKTIVYRKVDCETLFKRAFDQGLSLTSKPNN